jgi:hypothetical protein
MDPRNNSGSYNTPEWRRYRQAFDAFREKVRNMQRLAAGGNPDQAGIDAAVLEMEMAKEDYKCARDVLFLQIVPAASRRLSPVENGRNEEEVRELAALLWELEGRPEGSALDDWYRAESIHRRSFRACA